MVAVEALAGVLISLFSESTSSSSQDSARLFFFAGEEPFRAATLPEGLPPGDLELVRPVVLRLAVFVVDRDKFRFLSR